MIVKIVSKFGEFDVRLDKEDFDRLTGKIYLTYCTRKKYATIWFKSKNVPLHRWVMGVIGNKEVQVDHINRDTLDNRKENLRLCTSQQNSMNRKVQSDNSSGFKGVYWVKKRSRWSAQIGFNGKLITIGYYKSIEEAIEARDKKATELHKEFAYINKLATSQKEGKK